MSEVKRYKADLGVNSPSIHTVVLASDHARVVEEKDKIISDRNVTVIKQDDELRELKSHYAILRAERDEARRQLQVANIDTANMLAQLNDTATSHRKLREAAKRVCLSHYPSPGEIDALAAAVEGEE